MTNEERPVTLDEFVALIAFELNLTYGEQEELVRRMERKSCFAPEQFPACEMVAYYADDTFRNKREICREEAAALMMEASELIGAGAMLSSLEMCSVLAQFKDAPLVASWARPAFAAAVRNEWLSCGNAEMKPKSYLTQHEAVEIVQKFAGTSLL